MYVRMPPLNRVYVCVIGFDGGCTGSYSFQMSRGVSPGSHCCDCAQYAMGLQNTMMVQNLYSQGCMPMAALILHWNSCEEEPNPFH